jgi:hypothetical protein
VEVVMEGKILKVIPRELVDKEQIDELELIDEFNE